ncbi:calcium-dependent phosphotriesterase superfamily protein [Actinidia rufa]|uniref:Calcium-dependent phosphotriesterase superfamily protein n=1 Tax=Actinidia rufa TaxID=165716 RepID=A0A7J0F134_9ERIC|nr:calcium-dependent phosphotriesterase superfamily protein [Actinidia rufa]
MSESTHPDSPFPSPTPSSNKTTTTTTFLLLFLKPVIAAALLYRLDPFDPGSPPDPRVRFAPHGSAPVEPAPAQGCRDVASGPISGAQRPCPQPDSGVVYTGCHDGWIKRVTVNESVTDSVVEDCVNTGGRPLGLILGLHKEVIIADSNEVCILFILSINKPNIIY